MHLSSVTQMITIKHVGAQISTESRLRCKTHTRACITHTSAARIADREAVWTKPGAFFWPRATSRHAPGTGFKMPPPPEPAWLPTETQAFCLPQIKKNKKTNTGPGILFLLDCTV